MNKNESGIARRRFLRVTGIAGLALGFNLQRCLAGTLRSEFVAPGAGAASVRDGEILVGLDIGASKVRAMVGELQADGVIRVLGVGEARALGLRSGEVVDSEAAGRCVMEAIVDAEMKTDVMIGRVHLGVFGGRSIHGDGRRMASSMRCVQSLGVEVGDVALRPLASAWAVLDLEHDSPGAMVVDLGLDTTSYIAFAEGKSKGWGMGAVGGNDVTRDLSLGLGIPMAVAERAKVEEGSVRREETMRGGQIVIEDENGGGRKEIEREKLNTIIRSKVREIFERIKAHLEGNGARLNSFATGVHLTGGGSLLPGIDELAGEVFGIPARLARARGVIWGGSAVEGPQYSCAIGLLKLGALSEEIFSSGSWGRRYFYVIPEWMA